MEDQTEIKEVFGEKEIFRIAFTLVLASTTDILSQRALANPELALSWLASALKEKKVFF